MKKKTPQNTWLNMYLFPLVFSGFSDARYTLNSLSLSHTHTDRHMHVHKHLVKIKIRVLPGRGYAHADPDTLRSLQFQMNLKSLRSY